MNGAHQSNAKGPRVSQPKHLLKRYTREGAILEGLGTGYETGGSFVKTEVPASPVQPSGNQTLYKSGPLLPHGTSGPRSILGRRPAIREIAREPLSGTTKALHQPLRQPPPHQFQNKLKVRNNTSWNLLECAQISGHPEQQLTSLRCDPRTSRT